MKFWRKSWWNNRRKSLKYKEKSVEIPRAIPGEISGGFLGEILEGILGGDPGGNPGGARRAISGGVP